MTTLKNWEVYADDEAEQPIKRVKIKPSSLKMKLTHAVDPEWKEEREGKRRKKLDAINAQLSVPKVQERDSRQGHRINGITEAMSHDAKRRQSARVEEKK